jgi:hypothetical protein
MIFWNMKYLFYNCQLLLLCCVCCKFAIQAFMQEDRQAYKQYLQKDWQFYRWIYREMQNILPQSPTECDPSVFHRELQENYSILPYSPTAIPTKCDLLVFHLELQKNYGPCHNHRWIH